MKQFGLAFVLLAWNVQVVRASQDTDTTSSMMGVWNCSASQEWAVAIDFFTHDLDVHEDLGDGKFAYRVKKAVWTTAMKPGHAPPPDFVPSGTNPDSEGTIELRGSNVIATVGSQTFHATLYGSILIGKPRTIESDSHGVARYTFGCTRPD